MEISINTNSNIFFHESKAKNVSFGIKIPELETAIDTFVSKSSNSAKEEFNLILKIKKFANMIFQEKSFIGKGSQNKVYDMGKYVFRIPINVSLSPRSTDENSLNLSGKIIKNENPLNVDSYYGEPILQIGNLKILRNVGEHISCGVPFAFIDKMTKEEVYDYYFKEIFENVVQLPQSSFDKFAQDVKKIQYPKTIDFQNPNNTTITKDNRIILIDDLLNYNKYCGENSTAKLLRIFMLDAAFNIYTPEFDKYLNKAQSLLKKIVLSGEKAGLALSASYEDNLLIKDALYKCKSNVNSDDFIKTISGIRLSDDSDKIKLKRLKSYLDDVFK